MSWFYSILRYIPIINGIIKKNDLKSVANNLIKSFKMIKNKNITVLEVSEDLYEDSYFKITGTAKLGAKIISDNKKKVATIEFQDKKCINDSGYFKKISAIFKKLDDIKKKPKNFSYEEDIFNFKKNIGNSIINGKLHIIDDLEKEEIKLIFEISDTIKLANIYGHFELVIKFKKPTFKPIKNCSDSISKINSINEEEIIIFHSITGIILIKILNEEENSLSLILSWIYSIENNTDIKQNINNLNDFYCQFQSQ